MNPLKHFTNNCKALGNLWTDALKICKNTGIGYSTNQIYREDGTPQEEHPYEDCSCHYEFNEDTYWYAIFDGHDGNEASNLSSQLTAELYFVDLAEKNDEEIKEILRQAFLTVEQGYMQFFGDLVAERTSLLCNLPEGLNSYETYQKAPHVVEKIKGINNQLTSGAAAAVALIYKNKLYVANVGNCRVLLCKTDQNNVLKVVQLSVDHNLKNEDELLRLSQIGINVNNLRNSTHLGNQESTRCLGNYLIKGGYKEYEDLSCAFQEPIIAEPDIHGGIPLDESCRFLLLMSAELYKCIEDATGTDQVNKYIAQCVVEQFRQQYTLTGVAQGVVDKTVRIHHDWYMANLNKSPSKREDITLVLKNFNFPLPTKSPTTPSISFNPIISENTLTNQTSLENSSNDSSVNTIRTESDSGLGPDQKINPYVDFTPFYRNLSAAEGELSSFLKF